MNLPVHFDQNNLMELYNYTDDLIYRVTMNLPVHFDQNNLMELYNYTDDLIYIHRQLAASLRDKGLSVGVEVVKVDALAQALYDECLLEHGYELSAREARSKYAVKYTDVINDIYRCSHWRVIKGFYDCWGVLPNNGLDDYRSMGAFPMSLSDEFVAEAHASPIAQKHPVDPDAVRFEHYQVHTAEPELGPAKKPVYVEPEAEFFAKENLRTWYRYLVVDWDSENEKPCLLVTEPRETDFSETGLFIHDAKVYGFAANFALEGTKWASSGKIEWYTMFEMQEMYEESCKA